MSSTFFFSDVHLGLGPKEEEKAKEERLLAFLAQIRPATATLFIVGDLFDFWFDYKTVIPRGFHRTLSALQEFTDNGIPVHYLVGNHDCWMGDFFETELNIRVHRIPFETEVDGRRVYLHHGDGLAKNDLGYRLVKPILRNRTCIRMYRWLHPDIGVKLARGTSRSSREYTSQKHYGEEEGMIELARRKFAEGVDVVIMGHRHQPNRREFDGKTYINLGDWISYNTYAEMHDGIAHLNTWKSEPTHG